MSELKAEQWLDYSGEPMPCYPKAEADKVIADLEESHKMEVEQLLMEIVELKKQVHDYAQGLYVIQARAEKEARHDKYKRCLAMAKICENKLCTVVKPGWWDKWRKRWLELAKKFKEAK